MAELGVAASVVGIGVPALHAARLLLNDIQQIKGAPKAINALKNELRSLEMALQSLQAVEQPGWDTLGGVVAEQAKVTINTCEGACSLFRADLKHWTKHSEEGTLSWQDRVNVGFFKQYRIQALSDQLRNCYGTMNLAVNVAILYSSIHQSHGTEDIKKAVSEKRADIKDAIDAINEELAEVQETLQQLQLITIGSEEVEKEEQADKNAVMQIEGEHKALLATRKILEDLLPKTQEQAIHDTTQQTHQQSIQVTFGDKNWGSQIGVNYAPIGNMHFGK